MLVLQLHRRPPEGKGRCPLIREVHRMYSWVTAGLGRLARPPNKQVARAWNSLQQRLLLNFSRLVLVMGMYRITAVQVWYIQGRTRDHPSMDLPLLGSCLVLLIVWSFACFRTPLAMDVIFWLLQTLSFASMLLAQQSDVIGVVVLLLGQKQKQAVALTPQAVLALCNMPATMLDQGLSSCALLLPCGSDHFGGLLSHTCRALS